MTSTEDLEEFARRVDDHFARRGLLRGEWNLGVGDLPVPPSSLRTDKVRGLVGTKSYVRSQPCVRVELVLTRELAESIALLVLSVILAGEERTVKLSLAPSRIAAPTHLRELRYVVISIVPPSISESRGLSMQAVRYRHFSEERGRHPLAPAPLSLVPLPHLRVSSLDLLAPPNTEEDTLHGFGTAMGSAALAGALIDIVDIDDLTEFDFEGPYGFGGVSPGSAELKIWFPGSPGWELYPPG